MTDFEEAVLLSMFLKAIYKWQKRKKNQLKFLLLFAFGTSI